MLKSSTSTVAKIASTEALHEYVYYKKTSLVSCGYSQSYASGYTMYYVLIILRHAPRRSVLGGLPHGCTEKLREKSVCLWSPPTYVEGLCGGGPEDV